MKEEIVNTYKLKNGERVDTGETYIRNSEWNKGQEDYYIVGINNWIVNSKGEFLVQRRSLKKKNNPGKWSSTNGLIQLNEERIEAVIRETYEELGIKISSKDIKLVRENLVAGPHLIVDIFVTCVDVNLNDITIQESEVDKIAWVSLDELLKLDISTTCSYIKDVAPEILNSGAFRDRSSREL